MSATHRFRDQSRERRAKVRYPAGLETCCHTTDALSGEFWAAAVQDISATGIRLLMKRRFKPGTRLVVELMNGAGKMTHTLPVEVVRNLSRPDESWMVGCTFERELSEDEFRALL